MTLRDAAFLMTLGLAAAQAWAADPPRIVPQPEKMVARPGELRITPVTAIVASDRDTAAQVVAQNLADLILRTYGIRLAVRTTPAPGAIEIRRTGVDSPEGYFVDVGSDGAVITASTQAGLMHGATTLWQLLARDGAGLAAPGIVIQDAPRFAWRGLMLDSARHYQSPQFVRHFIDWMAIHKFNVLHWHLTDDQAWRLEIRKYPRLTSVGAWRVPAGAAPREDIDPATGKPRRYGGFYSQDVVRSIVAYAAERSITIVPEIEMPGHATAALVAYPRLAGSAKVPRDVPSDWGVYPNVFSRDEATFRFLEDVLREVMELFPSRYIHVGGDEVDPAHGQIRFTQRIARFLESKGRRLVGWDEILEPGMPSSAVVMSWRGTDGAIAAAAKGFDTIVAAHPTLYFDNRQSESRDQPPGRGLVVSLADVYAFEPMPAAIAPEQRRHVMGVQANIWTEHIRTEERVAWMTFPRAAAVAELGWSQPQRRDWNSFQDRMKAMSARYDALGLPYARTAPPPTPRDNFRVSRELKLCSDNISLVLEDDAPIHGPRAAFLVDIMNPCWIFPRARLDGARELVAAVGQVPFNFQVGDEVKKIKFPKPTTREGELEVRLDSCEGEVIARMPLAPAAKSHGVTRLPAAPIGNRSGSHDLCLRFAQPGVDPLWVIDSLEVVGTGR